MTYIFRKLIFILILSDVLTGCAGLPEGVTPVDGFETDRYLGKWYEIARLDHSFERGLSRVSAEYSLREDGGLKVVNRGFNFEKNEWDEAVGKAYFVGKSDIGALKVSFFGPFYGAYNILALDKQAYQYSLVAGPNLSYLWILARTPKLDQSVIDALVNKAQTLGFSVNDLIYVLHD
ncbi:MAG: apolipoprotein D and lipocalin family protein [Gammaproteobacteria bacterium]|jgi:apolipoprotein D and lipocalin family protein